MIGKISTMLTLIMFLITTFNCHSHKVAIPQWLQQHRQQRLAQFKNENKQLNKQNYTILLGNSITEGFPVETYFVDQPVLNRGIVADHSGIEGNGILQRLKVSVFDCKASKVFLMIGINDLADKIFTPGQIANGVKLIVQKIQQFDPNIKIYLQSALPTAGKYTYLNKMVLEFNQYLKKTADELKLTYIDLYPHFVNYTGEMQAQLGRDGLHLTDEGYKIWYQLILPYLGDK